MRARRRPVGELERITQSVPRRVGNAGKTSEIINFDCDPTSGRIVLDDREVNPNLYILEYEVSDGITTTSAARQITDEGTYRRPRWVTNLSREKAQPEAGVARPRW